MGIRSRTPKHARPHLLSERRSLLRQLFLGPPVTMNTYLGCVAGTDSRGGASMAGRHWPSSHPTALAATLDRISSTSNAPSSNTHMGSKMHGRTNSFDTMQTVVLTRSQLDKPWGFRIQGGQDYNLQLTVKKVCVISLRC
ncbi:unnamed protein product [Hydatigera taeniaeformis]|uniref:PDZ domain-containing protein n=1 Tax=Hydatigena taeniaeformis TaxID=6205 RepID=A0A0R3WI80_HYDTA|nr:unnamed protein product [Hydatigera taeniaeformis]